ncbi:MULTISPECIES: hypothetical protein [Bacillus cereus group]|uniref:hypothetical protein n=1 Tax=Bacillus cereus group TaxID=86661 RepID=UPI0008C3506A|nr:MULTISPECIES: hypothetical protein [Bacillus cereus group]PEM52043.1 hypothetical protein CN618_10075 [Bacillus wiedmannii]SEJ69579.1 hypothetical protein SAMN04487780_11318 [Bacillus thuringiensis]
MEDIKESKIRYLEMIQGVISRMASNSFLLKGWTVTIVVGLFAFANIKEMDSRYILLALVPAIFFWSLDGFFLRQEKLFRKLYDHVRASEEDTVDFSMDTSQFKTQVSNWMRIMISTTLLLFYIPIFIVIILALLSFPCINI